MDSNQLKDCKRVTLIVLAALAAIMLTIGACEYKGLLKPGVLHVNSNGNTKVN